MTRHLPGHTIACEIAGHFPKTHNGHQYLLTLTDLRTRLTVVHLLKIRNEAEDMLQEGEAHAKFWRGTCESSVRQREQILHQVTH